MSIEHQGRQFQLVGDGTVNLRRLEYTCSVRVVRIVLSGVFRLFRGFAPAMITETPLFFNPTNLSVRTP